jgi:hypothetical protein
LLAVLVFLDGPGTPDRVTTLKLIVGGYGDSAALLFPIWAWAARGLLDTEPDGQRSCPPSRPAGSGRRPPRSWRRTSRSGPSWREPAMPWRAGAGRDDDGQGPAVTAAAA